MQHLHNLVRVVELVEPQQECERSQDSDDDIAGFISIKDLLDSAALALYRFGCKYILRMQ